MRRWIAPLMVVLASAGLSAGQNAGQPQGKLVLDLWDAAYLEGGKAGYVHTTVYEQERIDGLKILRSTVELQLTLKRFKDFIQIRGVTGTEETAAGKVVGTFMSQQLGPKSHLTITGTVEGKKIKLVGDGKVFVQPWDDQAIGMYRQQTMFQDKKEKIKPGDKFSYLSFEPTVNVVLQTDVTVKDYENVELPDGKGKVKLLRVDLKPEKLEKVQLPTLAMWLDAEGQALVQQVDLPGLGKLTLQRTTREVALAPGPAATITDIGISQSIRLNKKLIGPYDLPSITYRITVKGEEDASQAFSRDDRQQVKEAKGATFVLQVKALRGPVKGMPAAKTEDEFIQSSYFITSADVKVKELARRAVGKERDPWKKALMIEKWVHFNMRDSNLEALAPADQVARTLEGDCTEFAMLMAAMCRAEGVPSKTAIGLLYVDTKDGPKMAFHMWTEVWVQGQWVPLDATLGRGYVGPTHLKITDHSWHETRSLTPLLPLIRVVGKVQIEVVNP